LTRGGAIPDAPAMRLGVLSTARINDKLLAGAAPSDEVQVVAVASRSRERAQEYARAHGIERAHGSYEALLADEGVDAVYISLPNSLHVEWSINALRAGKHVLCEKPLDRDPAEVERAYDEAEAAGRLLAEAFMYRHHPQTLRVRALVEEGAIGPLRLVRASFSFRSRRAEDVRLSRELAGGSLRDVGCYCVTASRFLAGEPELVYGQQALTESGVDGRFAGLLRFPGGVVSLIDCGITVEQQERLEVVGDAGSLVLRDPWHCVEPGIELWRGSELEQVEVERANHYQLELEDLAAAISGRRRPRLGREDAVAQARAIDALYRSAETGLPVTL
jgi:xylose dehydrogenase (NAD/NADP)